MIEASCGTAAKHGRTCLVDALVELGCADVALLIVIVRCACHDLGIGRANRAATEASIGLDADWAARRFRTRCQLSLSGRPVGT